jgi:hypothetical protein
MKRFRTGRAAPPWAGGQTGPMTVDVEALMSSRDPGPVKDPAKYVSPLNARHEYVPAECEPHSENIHTEAACAERANAPAKEVAPTTGEPTSLLDSLPAFKAALESLEKRGDPILIAADPELPDLEPTRERQPRAKRRKRKPRPIPTAKQVTLRPTTPRKQSQPKAQAEIDLSHHQRRCSICRHPDREAIEEAFLQWRRVRNIDLDFKPEGGLTAIYRHARAFNLFKQRNLGLRSALEFVIERAENVMPTAEGLVKAIRAYTRINDQGEWIDTPTTHIVKVMPMRDPEPRNVTPACPDGGRGGVTLDVKKISNCPNGRKARGEGKVEVTIESPSGRPLLTGSAPQTEIDATT